MKTYTGDQRFEDIRRIRQLIAIIDEEIAELTHIVNDYQYTVSSQLLQANTKLNYLERDLKKTKSSLYPLAGFKS